MAKSAPLNEVGGALHCFLRLWSHCPFSFSMFWWGCREEITSNSGLPFPGNHLLFQQVPMVEIDGMKLVQTRSILHYIADKHHLFGKDLKERTLYCGPSGVFSLVHLPMLKWLVVHFMSCIVSGNREQSPRKVKTSWKISTESLSKMRERNWIQILEPVSGVWCRFQHV